jgi:hypothetical protein
MKRARWLGFKINDPSLKGNRKVQSYLRKCADIIEAQVDRDLVNKMLIGAMKTPRKPVKLKFSKVLRVKKMMDSNGLKMTQIPRDDG